MAFENFSNILSKNSFGSRFPWFGGIMVVLRDMIFIGVCPARWSPVESARSLRFASVLISSEGVDGMLTSTPLSCNAITSGIITCKLYEITKGPGLVSRQTILHEQSLDSDDLHNNLAKQNCFAWFFSERKDGNKTLSVFLPISRSQANTSL